MLPGGQRSDSRSATLDPAAFETFRRWMYEVSGVAIAEAKVEMVRSRLLQRLHELGLPNFDAYKRLLSSASGLDERRRFVDALTTNKTFFFREMEHFDFLEQELLPAHENDRFNLWCAGCSSGEEPYSFAIAFARAQRRKLYPARILATDISGRVLEKAKRGRYEEESLAELPFQIRQSHFDTKNEDGKLYFDVKPALRSMVHFARLNLMEEWPMRGPFHLISCRNVMIYFDLSTRERLINRFWELLIPGGHLFIGHAETLHGIQHRYHYIKPAIYRK